MKMDRRHRRDWLGSAALLIVCCSAVRAQISPGDLSSAHSEMDRVQGCLECHGRDSMDEACLSCHREIAWLVARDRGLHGREGRRDCASCHPDHGGRDFELIEWEESGPERFDHRRSGWPLRGKHAETRCRACHQAELRVSPALQLRRGADGEADWIGLETACLFCHEDSHRGALGEDCLRCHGERGWKPAIRFDHSQTRFALGGKHAEVGCEKCHQAPHLELARDDRGQTLPLYRPLPHEDCRSCHRDPHQGRLGAACASCHTVQGFREVDERTFDHARTRYPLGGAHARVQCARCHDPVRAWGKRPSFERCDGCHRDVHAGQATLQGRKADCEACHRVEGFRPTTYGIEEHRNAAYPLEGRHREVACGACHPKNPPGVSGSILGASGVLLRRAHALCRDCHGDDHAGQLEHREHRGACETCHRVEAWRPSLFTAVQHAELSLSLEGRHAEIACAACHGPERGGLPPLPGPELVGRARVLLDMRGATCVTCHVDPHRSRFSPGGARAKADGCLSCHDHRRFRPAAVDVATHGALGYELRGAHRAVPCLSCHDELRSPVADSSLLLARQRVPALPFSENRETCAQCHDDPHRAQFALRTDGGACEACHGEAAFRPADRFDHDLQSAFPLEGAHGRVACSRCHPAERDPEGRSFVRYRPLPSRCESCHGNRALAPLVTTDQERKGGRPRQEDAL